MRLVIAAPANGAILKDALKVHLQNDPRVSSLIDLSSPEGTYPQLSFAAADEAAAGAPARRALLRARTHVPPRCCQYRRHVPTHPDGPALRLVGLGDPSCLVGDLHLLDTQGAHHALLLPALEIPHSGGA